VLVSGRKENSSAEQELDDLLGRHDLSALKEREQTAFDEATGPLSNRLVLFGAGHLGRRTLSGLRRLGIEPVAFADNDPRLWHQFIDGIVVLPPADAARQFGTSAAFIVTIWRGEGTDRMGERSRQLLQLGCRSVVPFALLSWKFPLVFLPHYALDLPHKVLIDEKTVRSVFRLWADEASRREYVAQIRWRLELDFAGLPSPVAHEIYFPDDLFELDEDEAFVDCGAFDGDTLRRFLVRRGDAFRRIAAFEPDPANFERLAAFVASLPVRQQERILIFKKAVGARHETVSFDARGNESSVVGSGSLQVESVALDEALDRSRPTYIKMDTEGSEPDALIGAADTIARHAPALAICSYHQQDHLWRIPAFVRSVSDRYRFFLRPHLLEVWDLVCYAVPAERQRR
jgi:FkbM family methyltransferase